MSGASAFIDDRALGKGVMGGKELEPSTETNTKFDDVKGEEKPRLSIQLH